METDVYALVGPLVLWTIGAFALGVLVAKGDFKK